MGVLARPVVETIKTATLLEHPLMDQDTLTEPDMERVDRAYGRLADRPKRRQLIFEHILPVCKDPTNAVLYFGPSINDAECMAFLLRLEGVPAAVISGETRDTTRRQMVSDFRSGTVQVLCSCEVLTTGFDAPRVTHVVMARPTVSQVLYEQMVGRGLRGPRFGGTDECTIIDCEDNYKFVRPQLGYQAFREIWTPEVRERHDERSAA
jgi:superfamily II DNA or RNA helicase